MRSFRFPYSANHGRYLFNLKDVIALTHRNFSAHRVRDPVHDLIRFDAREDDMEARRFVEK